MLQATGIKIQHTYKMYIHGFKIVLIYLVIALPIIGCRRNKVEYEQSERLSMTIVNPYLQGNQKQATIVIKPKDSLFVSLKNFKLIAQFKQQQKFGPKSTHNYLVYKNYTGQDHTTDQLSCCLTEFTNIKDIIAGSEPNLVSIPITLQPDKDITRLVLSIELVDSTGSIIENKTIEWIKDEFLIGRLQGQSEEEHSASLLLQNAKRVGMQPGQTTVRLSNPEGAVFHFQATDTAEATLEQLLQKSAVDICASIGPIGLKLAHAPKKLIRPKITVTVEDASGTLLAQKDMHWPYTILEEFTSPLDEGTKKGTKKATKKATKKGGEDTKKNKKRSPKQPKVEPGSDKEGCKYPLEVSLVHEKLNAKKFKIVLKNTGSDNLSKKQLNNITLHYTITDADTDDAKIKKGNRPDINDMNVGDLLGDSLPPGESKEVTAIINPDKAKKLTASFTFKGLDNIGPILINWQDGKQAKKPKQPNS